MFLDIIFGDIRIPQAGPVFLKFLDFIFSHICFNLSFRSSIVTIVDCCDFVGFIMILRMWTKTRVLSFPSVWIRFFCFFSIKWRPSILNSCVIVSWRYSMISDIEFSKRKHSHGMTSDILQLFSNIFNSDFAWLNRQLLSSNVTKGFERCISAENST